VGVRVCGCGAGEAGGGSYIRIGTYDNILFIMYVYAYIYLYIAYVEHTHVCLH